MLEPELWPSPGPLPSISSDPYLHADGQTLEFVIAGAYHADGVLVEIWAGPIGPLQVHQVGEQPPVFEPEDPTASGELAQGRLVVNLPAATEVADVQSRLSSAAAPSSPQSLEAAAFGALDVNVTDDLPDVGEGEKRPSAGPSSAYDGGGGHDGPTAALDNLQAVAAAMASIQQQEEEARHQHQHQDDQQRQGQQHQQQQQQLADTELLDPNLHSLIELAGGEPGFSQHQHQTEQHQQHQQDQLSTEHQHRVLSAHEESAAYETQAPPPPPFVYPPPATAGTSSPPKAVPLIFVRRSRSDGVVSIHLHYVRPRGVRLTRSCPSPISSLVSASPSTSAAGCRLSTRDWVEGQERYDDCFDDVGRFPLPSLVRSHPTRVTSVYILIFASCSYPSSARSPPAASLCPWPVRSPCPSRASL